MMTSSLTLAGVIRETKQLVAQRFRSRAETIRIILKEEEGGGGLETELRPQHVMRAMQPVKTFESAAPVHEHEHAFAASTVHESHRLQVEARLRGERSTAKASQLTADRLEPWRTAGAFRVGDRTTHDLIARDPRRLIAHDLRASAATPAELRQRQWEWNHPEWQRHLLGVADDRKDRWLPLNMARGTEKPWTLGTITANNEKLAKGQKPKTPFIRTQRGPWSESELAHEDDRLLYKAWLSHRSKISDAGVMGDVIAADTHGIPHDLASRVEGERHLVTAAEKLSDLTPAQQRVVTDKMALHGIELATMKNNIRQWIESSRLPGGEGFYAHHWYEGAHVHTALVAQQMGISHPVAAAVAAAHSPQTPWEQNRLLVTRTIALHQEDPLLHVRRSDLASYQKEYHARESKAAKLAPGHEDYEDAQALRLDPLPADLKPGLAHASQLPPGLVAHLVPIGTMTSNTGRALKILRDGDIERHLRGPKIRSFYNNIIDPHSNRYGTVDIWMVRAAVGDAPLAFRSGKGVRVRPAVWNVDEKPLLAGPIPGAMAVGIMPAVRQAFHEVGQEYGLRDAEAQAIGWYGIKNYWDGKGLVSDTTGLRKVSRDEKKRRDAARKARYVMPPGGGVVRNLADMVPSKG